MSNQIISEIVEVTPDLAREWLGYNTINRRHRPKAVSRYARDMLDGNWRMTGESIKFDHTGRLLDGQNRCLAVIQAGVTVPIMVTRGLPPDSQEVMDAGERRTNSDQLTLRGITNSVVVASIAAAWTGYSSGTWRTSGSQVSVPKLSSAETIEFVLDHLDVEDAARIAKRTASRLRFSSGVIGASWLILSEIDKEAADEFFEKLIEYRTDGRGDPVATLLKISQTDRDKKRISRPAEQFHFIFRTWNAWRKGERLTVLRTGVRRPDSEDGSRSSFAIAVPK